MGEYLTQLHAFDQYVAVSNPARCLSSVEFHGEYLFPVNRSDTNCQHRSRRYFEDRLSELCEKADVERTTPHQLRHYFATYTLSNGADVKAVSEMLGHADVGITLKIYHHVNASAIREMHREYSPIVNTILALPRVIRN